MTKDEIVNKLFFQFKEQGFLLQDSVLSEIIANNISDSDMNRIFNELLSKGVLIRNISEKDYSTNFNAKKHFYDKAHKDYTNIFNRIVNEIPSLKSFITYVSNILPPQRHEASDLIIQAKSGNSYAINRLFEMHIRHTIGIVYKYSKRFSLDFEDTLQDALISLYKAIDKYVIGENNNFFNYAAFHIINSIKRSMFTNNFIFHIPSHMRENVIYILEYFDANKIRIEDYTKLSQQNIHELEEKLALPYKKIISIIRLLLPTINFDDNLDIIDSYSDVCDYENEVLCSILRDRVNELLNNIVSFTMLTERELEILKRRAGYWGDENITLEDIGIYYNVTRERIRQIEKNAIKKIRKSRYISYLRDCWQDLDF